MHIPRARASITDPLQVAWLQLQTPVLLDDGCSFVGFDNEVRARPPLTWLLDTLPDAAFTA